MWFISVWTSQSSVFVPPLRPVISLSTGCCLALFCSERPFPWSSPFLRHRHAHRCQTRLTHCSLPPWRAVLPTTLGKKRCPPEEGTFTLSPSLDFPGTGKDCGLRFVDQRMLLQGDLWGGHVHVSHLIEIFTVLITRVHGEMRQRGKGQKSCVEPSGFQTLLCLLLDLWLWSNFLTSLSLYFLNCKTEIKNSNWIKELLRGFNAKIQVSVKHIYKFWGVLMMTLGQTLCPFYRWEHWGSSCPKWHSSSAVRLWWKLQSVSKSRALSSVLDSLQELVYV